VPVSRSPRSIRPLVTSDTDPILLAAMREVDALTPSCPSIAPIALAAPAVPVVEMTGISPGEFVLWMMGT
jgi:hypothetical protein